MISHRHKCIFIHISKCAGTSIENALGLDKRTLNYNMLYGWCPENRLYLQHATPQQIIDLGYVDRSIWDSYYKFIIVRNPWDRAYSDYLWAINNEGIFDSFRNFILAKGYFSDSLSREKDYNISDHLTKQVDYLFLDGKPVRFNRILRFENLKNDLVHLAKDLSIPIDSFKKEANVNKKRYSHYSLFYTRSKIHLIESRYTEDIQYLEYSFEDKKSLLEKVKAHFLILFHPNAGRYFLLKYPKMGKMALSVKKIFD